MNVPNAVRKSNCSYKLPTLNPSWTTSSPSPPSTHKGASSMVWVSKSRNLIFNDYSLSQTYTKCISIREPLSTMQQSQPIRSLFSRCKTKWVVLQPSQHAHCRRGTTQAHRNSTCSVLQVLEAALGKHVPLRDSTKRCCSSAAPVSAK